MVLGPFLRASKGHAALSRVSEALWSALKGAPKAAGAAPARLCTVFVAGRGDEMQHFLYVLRSFVLRRRQNIFYVDVKLVLRRRKTFLRRRKKHFYVDVKSFLRRRKNIFTPT